MEVLELGLKTIKLKGSVSSEVDFFSDIDDQTGNLLNHHRTMMKYMQSQMADFDKPKCNHCKMILRKLSSLLRITQMRI